MDNYLELFAECLIKAKPLLETSDREQIKSRLSNPATAANLVLSSVDEVLHKLAQEE